MPPRYRDIPADSIPQITLDSGVMVKLVSGTLNGIEGPVKDIVIEPELMDVTVPPGVVYEHRVSDGHTVVTYCLAGSGKFDEGQDPYAYEYSGNGWSDIERGCTFGAETVILYEREGDVVRVTAGGDGIRFLLLSGRPLGEPVAWQGPIVMNSREELKIAFEEYNNGTFIKL